MSTFQWKNMDAGLLTMVAKVARNEPLTAAETLSVAEFLKDAGVRCRFQSEPFGCAIHCSRPTVCRAFKCGWLRGAGPEEMRPDLCGLVVVGTQTYNDEQGTFCYARQGAVDSLAVRLYLERLAEQTGRPVWVVVPPSLFGPGYRLEQRPGHGLRLLRVLPAEAFSWRQVASGPSL